MADLTILIPLDGSKRAEQALLFLRALKPLGNLKARIVSVAESDIGLPAEEDARREREVAAYLDDVCSRTEQHYGIPVECIRRIGKPFAEILDEARRQDVNLILMTTHGHSANHLEHLGSVADKVIRGAYCPTLVIGPHAGVPLQIERITVPLDGSRLAAEALPLARSMAEKLGASLRLVRAVPYSAEEEPDIDGSLAIEVIESIELTASLYLAEAKLELETSRPVETAVLTGPAAEALLTDVREHPADLLLMTSHGRTGFIRWALGSVTERMMLGPVPVLVIRPATEVGHRIRPLVEP